MNPRSVLAILLVTGLGVPVLAQEAVHLAAEVSGTVTVRRSYWQQGNPLLFGMPLLLGDSIELADPAASVTIVCADLSTQVIVGTPASGVKCPVEDASVTYRGDPIQSLRALPGEYPRVLSPRLGRVLTPTPSFSWQAVDGAEGYTVQLKDALSDELLWQRQVPATELAYPEDEGPLALNGLYRLEVSTTVDGRQLSSLDEKMPDLSFEVLGPGQDPFEAVRVGEIKTQALRVAESGRAYVLATLYASNDLFAEAIERLQTVSGAQNTFAVQFLLGELYVSTKLPDDSEGHFTSALELAQQANDIEGQARSHNQLGQLAGIVRGNLNESQRHHDQALAFYQQLSDEAGQAETYYLLGELFEVNQNQVAAKTSYEQALNLYQELGEGFEEEITTVEASLADL